MNIGCHVPMHHSKRSADKFDADVVQLHLGSPQQWGRTTVPEGEIADRLYVHAPYLINLSSVHKLPLQKSQATLIEQGKVGKQIGALGLVIHGGSWKKGEQRKALVQWAKALSSYKSEFPRVLVENSANGKHSLTRNLHDLHLLWKHIGDANVGYCLDTAHLWANVATPEDAEFYIKHVQGIVGRIQLVHANGSSALINSGVDRHSPLSLSVAPAGWVAWCVELANPKDVVAETTLPKQDIAQLRDLLNPNSCTPECCPPGLCADGNDEL